MENIKFTFRALNVENLYTAIQLLYNQPTHREMQAESCPEV